MAKDKTEKKERYAHAFPPSQIKKMDKLAEKLDTSRAKLYVEGGELVLEKYGVKGDEECG